MILFLTYFHFLPIDLKKVKNEAYKEQRSEKIKPHVKQ